MALIFPKLQGLKWDRVKTPTFNTGVRESTSGQRAGTAFMQYPRFAFEFSYDYLPNDNTNVYLTTDLKSLAGLYLNCQARAKTFLYHDPDDYHVVGGAIATADGATASFLLVDTIMGGPANPVGQIDLSQLAAFASTAVDPTTDEIHIPGHGFTTGQYPPMFITSDTTLPTPLVALTPYWPIVVDADHIKLATTHANAMGGTAIDITAAGAGNDTLTNGIAVYDNGTIVNPGSATLVTPRTITFGVAPTAGHAITADFDYYFVCRFDDDKIDLNQFVKGWYELQKLTFSSEI